MPNLFKIDFIQGKTDASDYNQVKHSLEDTATNRAIISLSVSADKLQSVSNYSREPKRLVFECFPTTWIEENILSGNNEHERYLSHFEVRVYRDNSLFFIGIIDTSQLSFDVSSGILKITVTIRSSCFHCSPTLLTITRLQLVIYPNGYSPTLYKT